MIKRTGASEQKRLQQLFNAEELGDRKPSQLLRRMEQLLGDKARTTDGAFLRELFLQRLPQNVRMVLASTADTGNLDDVAQLADKIMKVATPSLSIAAVSTPSELECLRSEVAELKSILQGFQSSKRSSSRRSPSPAPRRQPPSLSPEFCWYHTKFGDNARPTLSHIRIVFIVYNG